MPSRGARVLMVSSEVQSLARTGGLGDVVEALAGALARLGADVVVVTPKYGVTHAPAGARWWPRPAVAPLGLGHSRELGVLEAPLAPLAPHGGAAAGAGPDANAGAPRVCLLADAAIFDRDGIYGDRHGPFGDNPFRFAALSSGALSVAERAWGGALPDVVHAHDWHASLSVVYARRTRGEAWSRVPTVFTIHNVAFQGVVGPGALGVLAVPPDAWDEGWARHDGSVNLMKGAIELADRVTTVSETYAREILREPHGHGLAAHLRWHAGKLVGIVNGIDTASFDPRTDSALARTYGPEGAVEGKLACKRALCAELGLDAAGPPGSGGPASAGAPLLALVSRLQWLKGVDLLLSVLPALVERGVRAVLVGTGDPDLEAALRACAVRWPGRVAARTAFDPDLARRAFAGADFLVVPSRDEPCGLTQMYAMRYGALPVVTPVGGLRDTVAPIDAARDVGTGFVARAADAESLLAACEGALELWRDRRGMAAAIGRAMARDSSWDVPAERYVSVYDLAAQATAQALTARGG